MKNFLLIRVSIYLTGLLLILGITLLIWHSKETTPTINRTENGKFFVFTEKNYNHAKLTIKFEEEIPENLEVTLKKDFSVLLNKSGGPIISEEELREKLFKENYLGYPNGKIINYQDKIYIIQKGFLKEIQNSNFLKIFGLNKDSLKKVIFNEKVSSSIGHPFNYKKIKENFPERVLIKDEGFFYLTDSESCNPVYIPEIETLIEKYGIQTVEKGSQSIAGKCYQKTKTTPKIICDFQLNKDHIGNVYQIQVGSGSKTFQNFDNIKLKFY